MNSTLNPCLPSPTIQQPYQNANPPLLDETRELQNEVSLLQQMKTLLQSYQQECIDRLDLKGAKETRSKINQLIEKEQQTKDKIICLTQDRQALEMSLEQQDLIQCFDRVWSEHLNQLVSSLAEQEQQLKNDQKQKRRQLNQRFDDEKVNGFKPSTKLTNLKRKVVGLMKLHSYEEAEFQSIKTKNLQSQERKHWQFRTQQRRRNALELFTRKSVKDFQVLRSKNQDILFKKMNQRDTKFGILLKKNQVRRVQANRSTKELMKSISTTSLTTKRIQS